jgi:hypothetical protein
MNRFVGGVLIYGSVFVFLVFLMWLIWAILGHGAAADCWHGGDQYC